MMKRLVDLLAAGVVTAGAPLFKKVGNWPGNFPIYLRQADRLGIQWRSTHYYHPTYRDADLPADVTKPRDLPGLDLHEEAQLALLASFQVQGELDYMTTHEDAELAFQYDNGQYNFGDAESLYAMVRRKKPRRIFEIGSGNSTRIVNRAIARNRIDDPAFACRHICIEPYEMPWLERLGPEIIRKRVQDVPLTLFDELDAGDILFIDSSHVIRPFGDVLVEFQSIIPRLAKGVIVHVHDIFTPRDYPETWLRSQRRLWNEQYLLEVLLTNSSRYRTLLALNWLANEHRDKLVEAFPPLGQRPDAQPGAYWFEVIGT
ncbi:MAG: class I SAM-dependent methyltransferase [Erythrobacter sp.]